jgi:hypothetical protein
MGSDRAARSTAPQPSDLISKIFLRRLGMSDGLDNMNGFDLSNLAWAMSGYGRTSSQKVLGQSIPPVVMEWIFCKWSSWDCRADSDDLNLVGDHILQHFQPQN